MKRAEMIITLLAEGEGVTDVIAWRKTVTVALWVPLLCFKTDEQINASLIQGGGHSGR